MVGNNIFMLLFSLETGLPRVLYIFVLVYIVILVADYEREYICADAYFYFGCRLCTRRSSGCKDENIECDN